MKHSALKRYQLLKRALDIGGSTAAIVVTLPIQLVVALSVAVKLGRPLIFRQLRPGLHGRIFTMYKWRTMLDVNEEANLLTDKDRLTDFGKFLRATSLDELPSLWNVLKGDMSMVGPRPLHVRYLDRYSPFQAKRHDVRPGLTGLAQVSGRNSLSWEARLTLDVKYVDRRSLGLDFWILCKTIRTVISREGISSRNSPTMVEFEGNELKGD